MFCCQRGEKLTKSEQDRIIYEEMAEIRKKTREEENERENKRIKIVSPIDIDKLNECKSDAILAINMMKKKKYIYSFFTIHANSRQNINIFHNFHHIINVNVSKGDENTLRRFMDCVLYTYDPPKIIENEFYSIILPPDLIDIIYDFCVDVTKEVIYT